MQNTTRAYRLSVFYENEIHMRFFLIITSSGSRNFKTGGRGPGAVEFLGLGFVLMPLQTYRMCL